MKKRLLYAEDDEIVRRVLGQLLTLMGWQVTCAPHGAAALERARTEDFDVIVTDHHMPGKDGLALVQDLRSKGFPGRIYVISGALAAAEEAQYRRLNVDGIASKPVALTELRDLIGLPEVALVGASAA